DLGDVVDSLRLEGGLRASRHGGAIEDATVTLVVFLHGPRGGIVESLREVLKERRAGRRLDGKESGWGIGRGRIGDGLAGQQVAGEELARFEEFFGWPPCFGDRGIVIVAGGVGLERAVCAGPEAESGTAVGHVDAGGSAG